MRSKTQYQMMGQQGCNNRIQQHHNNIIYHNLHHHHHHNHNNNHNNKSTIFLPMLCSRPSMINQVHGGPHNKRPSSSSSSSDPMSPKISCIGQVKRSNKVKAVVYPNPPKLITATPTNNNKKTHRGNNNSQLDAMSGVKYSKLKKFFSSRNLTAGDVAAGDGGGGISIVDLDPPLPVVKRTPQAQQGETLWKRRSGGATAPLKGLHIHRSHPHHRLQPTTV